MRIEEERKFQDRIGKIDEICQILLFNTNTKGSFQTNNTDIFILDFINFLSKFVRWLNPSLKIKLYPTHKFR